MNESDYKIVRFTNISDFDFTGELGARFAGRDFFVPKGESKLFPLTLGRHLATHLARQILIRKSPTRDASQIDGRGSDRPLWDDSQIEELRNRIITEVYEEEKKNPESEADRIEAKVRELNKVVETLPDNGGNVDASNIVPVDDMSSPIVYKDKAQIIQELKTKGITFDARKGRNELESLLG